MHVRFIPHWWGNNRPKAKEALHKIIYKLRQRGMEAEAQGMGHVLGGHTTLEHFRNQLYWRKDERRNQNRMD